MKKCPNCNRELGDKALICYDCGSIVNTKIGSFDYVNFAIGALSFLIPIAGIVMCLYYRKRSKPMSRAAGVGTALGVIATVLLAALIHIIFG